MGKAIPEDLELFVLLCVKEEGHLGRYRLAEMLNAPEGEVRGLLSRLVRKGAIRSMPGRGAFLTKKGRARLGLLLKQMRVKSYKRLQEPILGVGPQSFAFHIAEKGHMVERGLEQRDAAVRAGAAGAITLVFNGSSLRFPDAMEALNKYDPKASRLLLGSFEFKRGDVLLISFSGKWWDALRGALAAAKALNESTKAAPLR